MLQVLSGFRGPGNSRDLKIEICPRASRELGNILRHSPAANLTDSPTRISCSWMARCIYIWHNCTRACHPRLLDTQPGRTKCKRWPPQRILHTWASVLAKPPLPELKPKPPIAAEGRSSFRASLREYGNHGISIYIYMSVYVYVYMYIHVFFLGSCAKTR